MDLITAMQNRHSVRNYLDKRIEKHICDKLQSIIDDCNREGDLHIQLITDEPKAFDGLLAHYGKFSGVKNYIALIGKKRADLEEKIGYYGEKIVLSAQALGLNSCWVAVTYKKVKSAFTVAKGEKLVCVIAIGYGATQGQAHNSKAITEVTSAINPPLWFIDGVKAALTAPTAMNKQKFRFELDGDTVQAISGKGFYTKIDLGIAIFHFELASGISCL